MPSLPDNVTLLYNLPKDQFESILTGAEVVIVPLREDVGASGQMLAISAARNAKPVVYTDLSVISYFFSDGAGIPYRLGDLDSLSAGLHALLSDYGLRERCGRKALNAAAILLWMPSCRCCVMSWPFDYSFDHFRKKQIRLLSRVTGF